MYVSHAKPIGEIIKRQNIKYHCYADNHHHHHHHHHHISSFESHIDRIIATFLFLCTQLSTCMSLFTNMYDLIYLFTHGDGRDIKRLTVACVTYN